MDVDIFHNLFGLQDAIYEACSKSAKPHPERFGETRQVFQYSPS